MEREIGNQKKPHAGKVESRSVEDECHAAPVEAKHRNDTRFSNPSGNPSLNPFENRFWNPFPNRSSISDLLSSIRRLALESISEYLREGIH
jgi:hypothetical protein